MFEYFLKWIVVKFLKGVRFLYSETAFKIYILTCFVGFVQFLLFGIANTLDQANLLKLYRESPFWLFFVAVAMAISLVLFNSRRIVKLVKASEIFNSIDFWIRSAEKDVEGGRKHKIRETFEIQQERIDVEYPSDEIGFRNNHR